jgi:membrane protein
VSRLRRLTSTARSAIDDAREDDLPMVAQALAFSLFLSIPGILLVTLGVFSLAADASDVARLVDRLEGVIPVEAATLIDDSLRRSAASTSSGVLLTSLGFALALWTTTSAATTLMAGLTKIVDRREGRSFVVKRLRALAIVACLLGSMMLVLGLLVLGPYLERWVGSATGAETLTAWAWWVAQWPILVGGLLAAFAIVLAIGPDDDSPPQRVVPGALVAVVIWLLASGGLAVYASQFGSYEKTWGTLSAVVVTLLWLWLTSIALLFGAEVNAELERTGSAARAGRAERVAPAASAASDRGGR